MMKLGYLGTRLVAARAAQVATLVIYKIYLSALAIGYPLPISPKTVHDDHPLHIHNIIVRQQHTVADTFQIPYLQGMRTVILAHGTRARQVIVFAGRARERFNLSTRFLELRLQKGRQAVMVEEMRMIT